MVTSAAGKQKCVTHSDGGSLIWGQITPRGPGPTCARLSSSSSARPPGQPTVQATAERSDTPSLGYLHLQLRGAVLLEHRVGQLLQKSIFRAHQLPRERRRPTDVWAQQSRRRAWGSGHRPNSARLPGFPLARAGRPLPREGSARHGLRAQAAAAPVLSAQHF